MFSVTMLIVKKDFAEVYIFSNSQICTFKAIHGKSFLILSEGRRFPVTESMGN